MARGRGGDRPPAKPAPVSGPGALAQRTDGGPAPAISGAGGQPYGERSELAGLEANVPSPAGVSPGAGSGAAGGAPGLGPIADPFGPTGRPNESVTAGLDPDGLYSPEDPLMVVRVAYSLYPHPSLARLLEE